jgi:ABC-type polysaccharide/polyol phosphate transport system ATPase subunit
MIHLLSVTKSTAAKHHAPQLGFYRTTIAVPTDRRVAILGGRREGKTLLLRLIARVEEPDDGIVTGATNLSPIGNSRSLLHPRLSCFDNISMIARMMGVAADRLIDAVDRLYPLEGDLEKPIATVDFRRRQHIELALLSILSFDCYLLDDAHQTPKDLLERYFDAAARRGAGMIFTTVQPRQVTEYAECAIVVRGKTARGFNRVEEAIEAYEQQPA